MLWSSGWPSQVCEQGRRRAQGCMGVRGPEAETGTNSSRAGREPDHEGFKSGLLGADKAALVECACGLS